MSVLHYGYTFRRYFIAAMLCAIAAISVVCFQPSHVYAQFDEDYIKSFLGDNEEQDLILQIRRGQKRLISDSFLALEKDLETYFPISQLAETIGVSINLDLQAGKADGFLLSQDDIYRIDTQTKTIYSRGQTLTLDDGEFFVNNDDLGVGDIYLNIDALNKLWPLDFRFLYEVLRLHIYTKDLLPYEKNRDLQRRHQNFLSPRERREEQKRVQEERLSQMLAIGSDYKLFSLPRLKVSNSFSWNQKSRLAENDIQISGRNNVLGTEADYNFSFAYNNADQAKTIETARIRFTRNAYNDGDLPFGLKSLSFGDGGMGTQSLIGENVSGRGISISNTPHVLEPEFNAIDVIGLAQPGWTIEIFVNNILEEIGVVPDNGEYRFENVELRFGKNEVKTILYGPLGEVEERIENHVIAGARAGKGKTFFRADLVDVAKNIIPLQSENTDPDAGKRAFKIEAQRGINNYISATASFVDIPTETEDKQFLTTGLNFAAFDGNGQIDFYKELGGGSALDTRFARALFGLNVNLRNTWFYDFQTQTTGTRKNALTKFKSDANISKRLDTEFGTLSLSANANHQEKTNNFRTTSLGFSQGLRLNKASLSNSIRASISNDKLSNVSGSFSGSASLGHNTSINASTFYQVQPHFDFTTFQARASNRAGPNGKILSSASLSQSLLSKSTALGFNFAYDFEKFLAGLDLNWVRGQGTNIGFRLSTSLAPYGKNGAYIADSNASLAASKLRARIFVDKDGDKLFGPEDRALEGETIRIGNRTSTPSDENGLIDQIGVFGSQLVGIRVNEQRFTDPFLKAGSPGYKTILRPGGSLTLDFPVVETGTIDGFASFENGKTLPGITLQLLDEEGRVLNETRTMFDGFFQFDYIFPGTYVIQASPKYEKIFTAPQTVVVASDDPFVFDLGITLQKRLKDKPAEKAEIDGMQSGRIAQTSTMNAASAESVKNAASQTTTDGQVPLAAPVTPVDETSLTGDEAATEKGLTSSETYMTEPTIEVMYNPVVTINHIRLGQHPDKLRLVLDLSGTVAYRLHPGETGDSFVIDLPNARPDATLSLPDSSGTFLTEIKTTDLEDGAVTQLVLKATGGIKLLDEGLIPASSGSGMRLYIDLAQGE